MGYKILGFAVWQGAKWYVRRRVSSKQVTAAAVVAGVALAAGAAVAVRQATSHE